MSRLVNGSTHCIIIATHRIHCATLTAIDPGLREVTSLMPLARILEPEVMDSHEEASDYDAMDHSEVNRIFVEDLLAALTEQGSGFRLQDSASGAPPTEPRTLNPEPSLLDILDLGTGTALIPI